MLFSIFGERGKPITPALSAKVKMPGEALSEPDSALVFVAMCVQFEVVIPLSHARFSLRGVLSSVWGLALAQLITAGTVAAATGGSSGDYLIDVWTRENGLPNSSVTAIAQTPDGYLWIGTYNGLTRFDGQNCVTYYPETTPELKNARVRRLVTMQDGTLWINTYDGSLTTYRDGRFQFEWIGDNSADSTATLISMRSNLPTFLLRTGEMIRRRAGQGTNAWEVLRPPGAGAGQIAVEDKDGVLWSRGRDQKLWRLAQGGFVAVTNVGLEGNNINAMVADSTGRVWVGTERELAVWNGGRFENMSPTNDEPVLNVMFFRVLPNGDVWSVANDRVRKSHGREWKFELQSARGMFLGWRERTGLHEDSDGGIWLYDYGQGIFHVRADGRARQIASEEVFPGERVDCFFEDREGNFWAGVDRGGLVRIRERRFNVLSPGDDPAARTAVSVAEDADGAIWVGTYGGGLHRWLNNEWRPFSPTGGSRRGYIFSVFPDDGGRLWTSAGEEDLYVGNEQRFVQFNPAVHGVKALLRARDGRLWVGTKGGLGVVTGSQFKQFYPQDGVARTYVHALAEDPSGGIWAGAGDGILYHVQTDGRTNRVTSFRANDAWAAQPIWSLLADDAGVVWAGTFRGGLLRLHNGRFTRFTSKHGLPDDVVCQILDDKSGRLWGGTEQGIFRVNKSELNTFSEGTLKTINSYGRYDGLPSVECSSKYQPSAWRTRDGRLLFAMLGGVVSVKADEVKQNLLPPPVLIERALLDGEERSPSLTVKRSLRSGVHQETMLTVPPGKRQVVFHFNALSFVSPDRVRFRYKLEGLDQDWIEAGGMRSAQYSFLAPAEYRFRVMACNNDGVWSPEGATWTVIVQPHFYEQWWFKVAAWVLGLGLIVFAVRRIFVRRLRRQVELLERQRAIERDRARIAKDIHDDLGAGLTHISLLSELARRDTPQALPGHVGQISDMARELTRNMDEIVWAIDPQKDTLDSLVSYVAKFAQEYLSVAGVRCRMDLPTVLPPYSLPAEVRHNLFLSIKEALNNIVKHARASEVWLRLQVRPQAFTLVIEDNGRGLAGSADKTGDTVQSDRFSSGRGLDNMRRRLNASGGRCEIASEPGRGTSVKFIVDLSARRSPELATGNNNGHG